MTSFIHRIFHYPWRPSFYYGWAMAPVAMVMLMCTAPAQTYGVSVFTPYIRASLDLSPAQIAALYMAGTLLASLPLMWVGSCMDRYGLRRTGTVIVFCFVGACLVLSQSRGAISLLFAFFILRLFGQGSLSMVSSNTLAFWVHRRLGLVTGLKSVGVAAAIAGAPRLHYLLIQAYGWRVAYVVMGLLVGSLLLPLLALFYRNHPEDVGQRLDGAPQTAPPWQRAIPSPLNEGWAFRDVLRAPSYYMAASSFALWALIATAVSFSASAVFESRGLTADTAAAQVTIMFSAVGASLLIGNILVGAIADRIPQHWLLSLTMLTLGAVGLLLGLPGSEQYPARVGMALGASQALMTVTSGTIWVRYFGRRELGRIRGSVMTAVVAASSMGPLVLDGTASQIGAYEPVLMGLAIVPLVFAVMVLFARKPMQP